jgi:hypothetical protein
MVMIAFILAACIVSSLSFYNELVMSYQNLFITMGT